MKSEEQREQEILATFRAIQKGPNPISKEEFEKLIEALPDRYAILRDQMCFCPA